MTRIGDAEPDLVLSSSLGRKVVAVTVLGSGIASIDATVVGIALPVIGKDFRVGVAELQWVVNGYLLTLAGLLLLGGVLGDRYGRRRVYLIGVIWFAIASLGCAAAPNAKVLIGARILQGVGGALLAPGGLAILQATFAPTERARAIGAWSGFSGLGTAIGPFVGGYLISAVSWRLIFLINLPLSILIVITAPRVIPETRDLGAPSRVDFEGGLMVTVGLVGVTYGLIEGPALGWHDWLVVLALVLGVGLLFVFVLTERHHANPLLPIEIFTSRQFSAANLVTFLVYGALGGAIFLLPIELEQVARYTPLEAGASLLPVTALMLFLSARFGALSTRFGPRLPMSVGPFVVAAGILLLARIGLTGSFLANVLPAVLVFGFGLAITVAPLTATVLAAAPGAHSGAASAINNDVSRVASLVMVAVLPAAAGITGLSYLHPARFDSGFHTAMVICAAAAAVAALLGAFTIKNPARPPRLRPRNRRLPDPATRSKRRSQSESVARIGR